MKNHPDKYSYLLAKAEALGIEAAKIIDCSSVAVGEWVQWKCKYGCPFYNRDAFHPPMSPSVQETRQVLQEYDKALLLNGSNGPLLSQLAVQIEHEAYTSGLYKAFALVALPFGDSPT